MTRIANQDFTLTRDDCRPLPFVAGQEIPAEYESHWWVLLHTDEAPIAAVEDETQTRTNRETMTVTAAQLRIGFP
jgi:hypothetical protein